MQRTIRALRIALPVAFFGFILLIALSWNRARIGREKGSNEPVTSTIRPVDKPSIESKTFEDTQTIAGRVASHIRATRVVAFQSGWNTLEDVQLTIYRPTGLTYELRCPTAQFNSETKEADAKGGVKVLSSDNVEMTTAEIHFDGNRLTNHIPVQFKIDRWIGTAGALDLDVQAEQLRLYDKVDATAPPLDANDSTMNLKASEGVFSRKENKADFNNNVIMNRDASRLTGDHVQARLSEDHKTLMDVEGQGHINIVTTDTPGEAGTGRKEITCDRFWSDVANGQMSAINAAGDQALAHAVIDGPPKRDLVAKTMRVGLTNKQVTDFRAENDVLMKEIDTARQMTTVRLTIFFDPRQHRATNAAADQNFHYKDPKNSADAVRANYDILNDRIVITGEPGYFPVVTSDAQTMKAKQIEFSPKAGTAKATGEVMAQLVSKQNGPSADATTMFPANKPVFVNSDSANMRQATKVAVFTGHVRAWQDTNSLFADEMQVQGMGDQITARGNVRTFLYNTSSSEQRKTPMLTRSDTFAAHKAERRIDLLGNIKIDDEQRHMTGEKAAFFFDANRKLDHVDAENKIVLIEQPPGRKVTGDKANYLLNKRMIYIYGSPATVTDPRGTESGEQIAVDLARDKVEIVSPTATKATYKPQ